MKRRKNRVIDRLLDLLFPPSCLGCGELLPIGEGTLCSHCRGKWEQEKRMRCERCGTPHFLCRCRIFVPHGSEEDAAFADLPQNGIAQVHLAPYFKGRPTVTGRMILRAKDEKLSAQRRLMGRELSAGLRREMTETPVLSYVPRAASKVRVSGTDQARELAKGIGDAMGLQVTPLLTRHGGTDQKKKNAAQRFQTSFGRYRLRKKTAALIRGREIWLCDDVITTGASMLACAALLMRAGAKRILAVSVAHTARETEQEEEDEKENCN